MLALLCTLAHASSSNAATVIVGGGIDAGAGLVFPGPTEVVGVPQIEGDLGVRTGSFGMRIDLDLGVWAAGGPEVVTLVPEQAWIRVGGEKLFLAAGDFVGPWRRESVDPWDRGLTSASMLARHGLPVNVAGATLGGGQESAGFEVIGGLDLGDGYDLLGGGSLDGPVVLGAHGHFGSPVIRAGGGGFYRPAPGTGGLEVDLRVDAQSLVVEAELLAGIRASDGAMVAVEVLPHFLVSPTARIEVYAQQVGGALGVAVRPAPFARIAAEAAWSDGVGSAWIGADLFTPATSWRAGDGGAPSSRR